MKPKLMRCDTSVRITKGPGVRVKLTAAFIPEEIGAERTEAFYGGIGLAIAACLGPKKSAVFLNKWKAAIAKARAEGGAS